MRRTGDKRDRADGEAGARDGGHLVHRADCHVCGEAAELLCPRCEQRVCLAHGPTAWREDCATCGHLLEARKRRGLGRRVATVAAAALCGMVAGAFVVMLAASVLGLAPEIIVLLMLVAELGFGGLAAYAADRHVERRLRERASRELGVLPEARLLRD